MSDVTPISASEARERLGRLVENVERIMRGKSDVIHKAIIGLLAPGHILFEDVPGVGKTTLAQCLARSLGLSFSRIQFTSDLLPSDILGVTIYNPEDRKFEFRSGPIFANIVLVDEINRTTPKTQSALLEAMNSGEVSIEKTTYKLPEPFIVIATQNPIESHGTFPLPQSQLDRFILRLHLGYPDPAHEREVLANNRRAGDLSAIEMVVTGEELTGMQEGVQRVKIEDSLLDYIVRFAEASRVSARVEVGISTRGAIALRQCARARAYMEGRDYCIPDDIKVMAISVLAHRIQLAQTFESGPEGVGHGNGHVQTLLDEIESPI